MDNASEYLPLDVDYNVDTQYDVPPRTNQDNVTNNYGRQLLDICKVTGLRIINGRYHNDAHIGRFTCHTANDGHSTVDYLLARPDDIPLVRDFCVEDMSVVSRDHCPLTFTLTVYCSNQPERTSISTADYRYVWSRDKLNIYRDNLMSDDIVQSLGNIHNVLDNVVPDVNAAVNILVTNIESAATPCRRVTRRESDRKATVDRPRWWNDECYYKKKEFQRLWDIYKIDRTVDNYNMYQTARRGYRNSCRYHRKRHSDARVTDLCLRMTNQPKRFWRELKPRRVTVLPDIPNEDIFTYFANLNGTAPDMTTDYDEHTQTVLDMHNNGPQPNDATLDDDIRVDEVAAALKQLQYKSRLSS